MRLACLSARQATCRLPRPIGDVRSVRAFATEVQVEVPAASAAPAAVYAHTLDDGVVRVAEATPEQRATHGKTGTLFAVVVVKGKQYRVAPGDAIMTDKMESVAVGDKLELGEVLLVGSTDVTVIGKPLVADAKVSATVEEIAQTEKVHVFKKKRRKGYKVRGSQHSVASLFDNCGSGVSDTAAT
jgi:large subunit ribosomal protein L21